MSLWFSRLVRSRAHVGKSAAGPRAHRRLTAPLLRVLVTRAAALYDRRERRATHRSSRTSRPNRTPARAFFVRRRGGPYPARAPPRPRAPLGSTSHHAMVAAGSRRQTVPRTSGALQARAGCRPTGASTAWMVPDHGWRRTTNGAGPRMASDHGSLARAPRERPYGGAHPRPERGQFRRPLLVRELAGDR